MSLEGNVSDTADTSAGSLAGNDAVDSSPNSDAWEALSTGGEQAAPEATAQLTKEAKPDELVTAAETKSDDDPFAKITDPKREDWQQLRSHKDELAGKLTATETQLAEARPIVEKVQALGGTDVVDRLAALVSNPQASAEGVQTAAAFLDYIKAQDPLVGQLVREADYVANSEVYFDWALAERGLNRATFDALVKGGGQQQPQYVPTAYPVPDATGIVRVPSPDGSGQFIELDTSDARDNFTYLMGKREFEREQKVEQERQQAAVTQRQTQEQTIRAAEEQRVTDFLTNCDKDYEAQFGSLNLKVSDTPTKMMLGSDKPLTETQAAEVLTYALSRFLLDTNDNHQVTFREGQEIAKRGGQLADSKRLALKNDRAGILQQVSQFVVKDLFGELHELRRRVAGGATTGAPVIPRDAETVTKPNSGLSSYNPPPTNGSTDPYDDIWK